MIYRIRFLDGRDELEKGVYDVKRMPDTYVIDNLRPYAVKDIDENMRDVVVKVPVKDLDDIEREEGYFSLDTEGDVNPAKIEASLKERKPFFTAELVSKPLNDDFVNVKVTFSICSLAGKYRGEKSQGEWEYTPNDLLLNDFSLKIVDRILKKKTPKKK